MYCIISHWSNDSADLQRKRKASSLSVCWTETLLQLLSVDNQKLHQWVCHLVSMNKHELAFMRMLRYSPTSCASVVIVWCYHVLPRVCTWINVPKIACFFLIPGFCWCCYRIKTRPRAAGCVCQSPGTGRGCGFVLSRDNHRVTIKSVLHVDVPVWCAASDYSETHYHHWRSNFALEHRDVCSLCHFQAHITRTKQDPTTEMFIYPASEEQNHNNSL